MLARFDSRINRRGSLRRAGVPANRLRLLTGAAALLLVSWLAYRYLVQPDWLERLPAIIGEIFSIIEAASVITLAMLTAIIFWQQHRSRERSAVFSVEEMIALSPTAFERYVAKLFRQKGYRVTHRGRRGDRGVDLELTHPSGRMAIVQCKRYRNPIGPDIVRELFGTLIHERVHHAFLVTTADITESAREWAAYKPMTLIDGATLVQIASALNKNSAS
jgi:restriction system protein